MTEWLECTLGDILTLQRGFDITKAAQNTGNVPVVSSSGINSFHDVAMAKAPGVVIGRKGTLGTAFFLDCDYWPHDTSLWVKDFKGNEPKYCYYLLLGMELSKLDVGSANPTLNRNHVHLLAARRPPLRDQRRIASILGAYDDLIEVNRRRIAVLESMARGLFEEWFVRFRFPGRNNDATVETLHGSLPEGWNWSDLATLCEERGGIQTGPFGSQLHQEDYTVEGVPVVMPKNIAGLRIDQKGIARIPTETVTPLSRHLLREGDIVYGRRGDIGRRAFVSAREDGWFCGTGCLRLRADSSRAAPRFLFDALGLAVTDGAIKGRAQGATMPNLSTGVMKTIPTLYPPMALQRKYADHVGPLLDLASTLEEACTSLAIARDLLLPRLISGELSVAAAYRELETAA